MSNQFRDFSAACRAADERNTPFAKYLYAPYTLVNTAICFRGFLHRSATYGSQLTQTDAADYTPLRMAVEILAWLDGLFEMLV